MNQALDNIAAKDVMTIDVLTAYEGWSIKRLSSFLIKHGISGAPVIASDHTLVGVVTTSDIVNFESKSTVEKKQLVEAIYTEYVGFQYDEADLQEIAKKADENCTVNQVMTPSVIKVDEDTNLNEVAKLFLANSIHRVFVTKDGIITGVLSTTNILKAIVD